jgi:lipid A 3-O-deacylase
MYVNVSTGFFLVAMLLAQPLMAGTNTFFFSGGGSWDADGMVRLSYARDLDFYFWSSELGHFIPGVEAGGGLWFSSDKTAVHADISPMLRYVFHQTVGKVTPFIEGGIGAAYSSYEHFAGRKLGSHFQFRDVLGLGITFGQSEQYSLHARYIHYSNADLADENDGIDFFVLGCGVSF